jgi:hypothetical protein
LTSEEVHQGSASLRGEIGPRKMHAIVRKALLGGALLIYSVLFAEGFLRVFDPQAVMPRYITGTAWGVRGNIPDAHYWHHTPEVDVEYLINGQGLRADHNYAFSKAPGTCRIAVFGDSFFFGLEADYKNTFGAMLETRLHERGFPAEVLNFAVGGFGTAEMLRTYEGFGVKFAPDIVIYSWDASDLKDNVRSNLYRLQDGRLEQGAATYLPAVKFQDMLMRSAIYRFVDAHSQLYTFVRERVSTLFKKQALNAQRDRLEEKRTADSATDTAADDAAMDQLQHRHTIDLSLAILQRAHDEAVAKGAEFYLVDMPAKLTRTRFASSLGDMLPEVQRQGITVVSPLKPMLAAARPDLKLYYEKGLGHFTPTGMAIMVDEAVKTLLASPRLAACQSTGEHP